jgi:predicted ATPase/transcriptional regulator with XRE-family HTH domain
LSAFGHLLRLHRRAHRLTQEALAERAGVSARAVSDLERGVNRRPHSETARLLSEALSLSAADRVSLISAAQGRGESSFELLQGREPTICTQRKDDISPFVGRRFELGLLGRHLQGEGPPLLLFVGPPASGKSRLLGEVTQGAVGFGLHVLEACCSRRSKTPYQPLLDALDAYIRAQPREQVRIDLDGCAWLTYLAPELSDGLVEPPARLAVAAEQQHRLIVEAINRFLGAIAGPGGTLLVLDDLHWATPDTIDALTALVRMAGPSLRVVGAAVVDHLPEQAPLAVATADLAHRGLAVSHTLEPLSRRTMGLAASDRTVQTLPRQREKSLARRNRSATPVAVTPLVGRRGEIYAVSSLLQHPEIRLLTLTGPGGVGKTRLAQEVIPLGAELATDGMVFVPLAALGDPSLLPATIARALGLHETSTLTPLQTLSAFLRDKHILLVLDNFEHLLAAAQDVADLLAMGPQIRLLVTSRAPLRVRGEHEFPVAPLGTPDLMKSFTLEEIARFPAVDLFVRRAQAVNPAFQLSDENVATVAEICARVDGLPLALELLAARTKLLPPRALLARLVAGDGRATLRLLAHGARDLPARLQTMRAAIAWSYDLLRPQEQTIFRRIAVFAGGCAVDAAEAVCDMAPVIEDPPLIDVLSELVEQSLLQTNEQADGAIRLTMLETIRQFALDRLIESGEEEAFRLRHAEHCLRLAEVDESEYVGPRQTQLLELWNREHSNLRAALTWARAHDEPELGLRLSGALFDFWLARGFLREGLAWLKTFLALEEQGGRHRAGTVVRARALNGAGLLTWNLGGSVSAIPLLEESIRLYEERADSRGKIRAQISLGIAVRLSGDPTRGKVILQTAYAHAHELGDRARIALAASNLAELAAHQQEYMPAAALWEESLEHFQALGATTLIGYARCGLGDVYYRQGEYVRAVAALRDGLSLYVQAGYSLGAADALETLALARCRMEQWTRGVWLLGASTALRKRAGCPQSPNRHPHCSDAEAQARLTLGDGVFTAVWEEGAAMSLEEATAYACDLAVVGQSP